MELEPRNLGIPLYERRNWSRLYVIAAMAFVGWLVDTPTEPLAIVVSCAVGGGAFWALFFSPPAWYLHSHYLRTVSAIAFVVSLVAYYACLRKLLPYLHELV